MMTSSSKRKGDMSALLNLCAKLTKSQVSTSDKALEIWLDEGGACFFIRSGLDPGACACGITDDAAPGMKKELDSELASRGLRLFFIDPEEASDGIAELARLSDLDLRQPWRTLTWRTRLMIWSEGELTPVSPLKKKKKNRRQLEWE